VFGVVKRRFRRKCPAHIDDALDYVAVLEDAIHEALDMTPFFFRVQDFILQTMQSSGKDFHGYDV
jgi:hypothetical protein